MKDRRWLRLMAAIPLLCLLVCTNIYVDPGTVIHSDDADIAQAILDGNGVYLSRGNCDEMAMVENLVKGMPKHVGCVAIGPSLSVGIHRDIVEADSFYNLSASGLNFYDYLAELGMLEYNDVHADKIILCIDSYFFDEMIYDSGPQNAEQMRYAEYMLARLNGEDPIMNRDLDVKPILRKIEQAFSVTYFQSSVALLQKNRSFILPERWGIVDENTVVYSHYQSDGSREYSLEYNSRTEKDVLEHISTYDIDVYLSKGRHISAFSKETLRKLIEYYKNKGVEITFFVSPLPPALWDKVKEQPDADEFYLLNEIEAFANTIAEEYSIEIHGSLNPYVMGIQNADYLDSRHIRNECLADYYHF